MTEQTARIQVKVISDNIDKCDFDNTIDKVISMLEKHKRDGWEGIDIMSSYDGYDFQLYKYRPENDEEYNKRIQLQKKWEEEKKENRRKQYEELKGEFGNE